MATKWGTNRRPGQFVTRSELTAQQQSLLAAVPRWKREWVRPASMPEHVNPGYKVLKWVLDTSVSRAEGTEEEMLEAVKAVQQEVSASASAVVSRASTPLPGGVGGGASGTATPVTGGGGGGLGTITPWTGMGSPSKTGPSGSKMDVDDSDTDTSQSQSQARPVAEASSSKPTHPLAQMSTLPSPPPSTTAAAPPHVAPPLPVASPVPADEDGAELAALQQSSELAIDTEGAEAALPPQVPLEQLTEVVPPAQTEDVMAQDEGPLS